MTEFLQNIHTVDVLRQSIVTCTFCHQVNDQDRMNNSTYTFAEFLQYAQITTQLAHLSFFLSGFFSSTSTIPEPQAESNAEKNSSIL